MQFSEEVTLYDLAGHVLTVIPTSRAADSEMIADLWIMSHKERSSALAAITSRASEHAFGLIELKLSERSEEGHKLWMKRASDAQLVGKLWNRSGEHRSFSLPLPKKAMGREQHAVREHVRMTA